MQGEKLRIMFFKENTNVRAVHQKGIRKQGHLRQTFHMHLKIFRSSSIFKITNYQ